MEDKLIVAAAAAMLMAGCATAPRAPVEPHPDTPAYSWKPLFADDLSDAEFEKGSWKLEGGVLRSLLDKPIWTKADYEDYVLDFEYMMEKDGNSGVFIYLSNLDQFPKYKIEVQLLDDESPKFKGKELAYQQSGSLYGRAAALEIASKHAGEWNRMTVFCRGKSVHVVLNGKAVVDANLDDWKDPLVNPDGTPVPPWHRGFPALSTIPTRGRVGFQGVHGDAGVQIRNLRIASLGGAVARPPMKLGCQLWGVKDLWFDKPDKLAAFAEIFPKVRAMGYDGVQCGSFIRMDADGLEKLLNENGLSVVDQPISFEDVEDEAKQAKTVDAAEAKLRPYGIRVGYHHHVHELTTKIDGELPWDILTGPDGARLEMDIGPVLEGGRNPAEEIAKMKGRLPSGIHAKPLGATAAGAAGDMQDWPKVVAAAEKSGVKWLVVECEKRQDTFDDIAESARNLRPLVSLVNELR